MKILNILFAIVYLLCFFTLLTFNLNFVSMNLVIFFITLSAALFDFVKITQSSAMRTNCKPRFSNSLSNSLSIMLLSIGEMFPPCGVPFSVLSNTPFTSTPACRYFLISATTLSSFTVLLIIDISKS